MKDRCVIPRSNICVQQHLLSGYPHIFLWKWYACIRETFDSHCGLPRSYWLWLAVKQWSTVESVKCIPFWSYCWYVNRDHWVLWRLFGNYENNHPTSSTDRGKMDRLTFDLIKVIFFFKEHYFIRLKSKKKQQQNPRSIYTANIFIQILCIIILFYFPVSTFNSLYFKTHQHYHKMYVSNKTI